MLLPHSNVGFPAEVRFNPKVSTSKMELPVGVRFNPNEEELLSYYLKNHIMGLPLSNHESQFLIEIDMYGAHATPWNLFCSDSRENNRNHNVPFIPWHPSVDSSNKDKLSERILYVLTKLSNVGKTERSGKKQKSRMAGCGSWHANNTKEPITVLDKNGVSILIGYRRNFTFRTPTQKTVGQWNMTEYNINLKIYGLNKSDCDDYVLCKIKRDDTKSSLDGKLIFKKRKSKIIPKKRVAFEPSSSISSSYSSRCRINNVCYDENVKTSHPPTPLEASRKMVSCSRINDQSSFKTTRLEPFSQKVDGFNQNSTMIKPPASRKTHHSEDDLRIDPISWTLMCKSIR